jgi:hypothetical protein
MRELHGWHEAKRDPHRHAHDAVADAPGKHARDSPKHAAHDSLKFKMLLNPEARKAEHLRHRKAVQEYEAKHAAGQLKPQEAKRETTPPESRDKPASRIASRDLPESKEVTRKQKPERSWLPSNEIGQVGVSLDALFTTVNASYHVIPGRVDGIFAAALGVVVAGVAWANKRWKDKHHGDRPEG